MASCNIKSLVLTAVVLTNCARPLAHAQLDQVPDLAQCGPTGPTVVATGAVALDMFDGKLLFEKNPDAPLFPASATKILTALLVIEAGDLDREVLIEPADTRVEPSVIPLKPGASPRSARPPAISPIPMAYMNRDITPPPATSP